MKNLDIAQIFFAMADILEIQGVPWKPQAYRKAARALETISEDVNTIYNRGGARALQEISGIGENLAEKIVEFIQKGKITAYAHLQKKLPRGVETFMHVQSLGPKKALKLAKKLHITSLAQLENAARTGKIHAIEGFGEKSEQDILRGIELVKKSEQRMLLGSILPLARSLVTQLRALNDIQKIEISGSLRRMKETVRDIDILTISTNPAKVMEFFTKLPDVKTVLAHGTTKSAVLLTNGVQADIRVLDKKSYGAALQYFTGNKDHNIKLRQIAIKKGYKLNEYGLFNTKTNKFLCGHTEQEVYKKLGLPYIEPELRENNGEIEAARQGELPNILPYNAIKGDLHMHTTWSDGMSTPDAMILAAIKLDYDYIAITDHSKSEHIAHGMQEKQLLKYLAEIEKLKKKYAGKITIFAGSEVSIQPDGKLDYSSTYLKKLDWIIASVHSRFKQPRSEITQRILTAIENPYVNCIGHPTGRLINAREPYDIDLEKIFRTAHDHNVALEISATPERLDLKDTHIKAALDYGAHFVINTDAHHETHLNFMELGIAQARRGWATAKDILNTLPLKKFEKLL